ASLVVSDDWDSILDACGANRVLLNICHLQSQVPSIGEMAALFGAALGAEIRIDAFCSVANTSATPVHYDYDPAVIMQIHGTKEWRGYDNLSAVRFHFGGQKIEPGAQGPEHLNTVLKTREALFIPGGTIHAAFTTSDASVHL